MALHMHHLVLGAAAFGLAATAGAGSAMAQNTVTLWPAPALYIPDSNVCGEDGLVPSRSDAPVPRGRSIDAIFCPQLKLEDRGEIGSAFAEAVHKYFPNTEREFASALPAQASDLVKLRSSLAISLRLTRAAVATVPKQAGVDGYLPITLTVDVTNVATGEVVFSKTETTVGQGVFDPATMTAEIQRQFRGQLLQAMEKLTQNAAAAFKPISQTAQVVGKASSGEFDQLWILDKGQNAGLRAGDSFGIDGRILHSGGQYAILETALDELKVGHQVSRTVATSAAVMARPTVMVVAETVPSHYSADWVQQIFEDQLGASTTLAPLPINPAFTSLRRLVLGAAKADLPSDSRSLPDYVASVRLVSFDRAQWASGVSGVTVDRYAAHVFVTLYDRTGRAVGTAHGSGKIEDKVSGDMRFSEGQRRDAAVRNALADAAQKLASFKPQLISLPLQKLSDGLSVNDPYGVVPFAVTLPVMRSVGKVKGGKEDILIPVGQVTSMELNSGRLMVRDSGIVPLKLRGNEVVSLQRGGLAMASRQSIALCLGADAQPAAEQRGTIQMDSWAVAAEYVAASQLAAPFRSATLSSNLQRFQNNFAEFSKFAPALDKPSSQCLMPITAIQPVPKGLSVAIGYVLQSGGQKLTSSGMQTNLTPTSVPPSASAESKAIMLQQDFLEAILPTAQSAAAKLTLAAPPAGK